MRVLRRVAQDGLEKAVRRIAKKVGVKIGAVSIRNQSTRWGSCSSSGALSLNWRLILLPPAMHDHVILHELAHRIHMNHSERFWSQLEVWDPEWKRHDQELTKKWNVLMDLGR
jgi:predicted metal-dependent hydrolase